MKTFNLKPAEISRKWIVLDAAEAPLGRVATAAANYLIGKNKPTYTAHIDNGDYVIVINAAKTVVTGTKSVDKMYYRHSGYQGGLTETQFKEAIIKDPGKVLKHAIEGMLPKNKLMAERLKRLKVYDSGTHNHDAQKPVKIGVK